MVLIPSIYKLTHVFPAELASSSGGVGVKVAVSEVTLLVDPQLALVIIHDLLPVGTIPDG